MNFGFDAYVGEGLGISGTGFGMQEAAAAVSGMAGGEVDNIDAPTRDIIGTPPTDERSLVEKAAGWAVNKVEAKVTNMLDNPITTAINVAFGKVPAIGVANSISAMLGGPTVGSMVTTMGRAIASGDITPGTSFSDEPDVGNSGSIVDSNPGRVRYFRYRDGRIEQRLVDDTPAPDPVTASAENLNYERG